jgi:hypothetical protein
MLRRTALVRVLAAALQLQHPPPCGHCHQGLAGALLQLQQRQRDACSGQPPTLSSPQQQQAITRSAWPARALPTRLQDSAAAAQAQRQQQLLLQQRMQHGARQRRNITHSSSVGWWSPGPSWRRGFATDSEAAAAAAGDDDAPRRRRRGTTESRAVLRRTTVSVAHGGAAVHFLRAQHSTAQHSTAQHSTAQHRVGSRSRRHGRLHSHVMAGAGVRASSLQESRAPIEDVAVMTRSQLMRRNKVRGWRDRAHQPCFQPTRDKHTHNAQPNNAQWSHSSTANTALAG